MGYAIFNKQSDTHLGRILQQKAGNNAGGLSPSQTPQDCGDLVLACSMLNETTKKQKRTVVNLQKQYLKLQTDSNIFQY